MKPFLFLAILLITTICQAEHQVKVYHEATENGYHIYADNSEFCPVSIKIDFNVSNLNIEGGNNVVYVLNPQSSKQFLTTLTVAKKGKAYKFSFNYRSNYGNHNNKSYDQDYIYDLPYKTANSFKINQGYNGSFSHKNENALDFTMPVGTELTAIREGVVIKVVDKNTRHCGEEDCKKFNNLIIIYHPDGTFAEYTHIKKSGAIVKVGDQVAKGQVIGYSGNVGWSTGPHLHLVVYQQELEQRVTLKTKFKTGDGTIVQQLTEKETYSRDY